MAWHWHCKKHAKGDVELQRAESRTSQGREDSASMERLPRTGTANSLGARVPRKRVRVSLSCPVTLSTSVRSSSPFMRPATSSSTRIVYCPASSVLLRCGGCNHKKERSK